MSVISYQYVDTILGELIVASYGNKLCMLDYKHRKARISIDKRIENNLQSCFIQQDSDIINTARLQLNEYLFKQRKKFDIPILMLGSDFQKTVWKALLKIPFGTTTSYLELAKNIANPKAVRAVANANGANAMSIIIPCHRVIASNGNLSGYAGGLDNKKYLLNLES